MSALGIGAFKSKQIIIVEGQAVGTDLGKLVNGINHIKGSSGRSAKLILGSPADGPKAKRELVIA